MRSRRLRRSTDIERRLRIRFRHERLLKRSLTHPSATQNERHRSYETLEFLGDAVLELLIREHLCRLHPRSDEGVLSELKKAYACEAALFRLGQALQLGRYLILDKGEEMTGGRNRPSNIAACYEALVGALYLDQGLPAAKRFVRRTLLRRRVLVMPDHKSILNNLAMRQHHRLAYRVARASGPAHQKTFVVSLMIDGRFQCDGEGASKKQAEQEAARRYLAGLDAAEAPRRKRSPRSTKARRITTP